MKIVFTKEGDNSSSKVQMAFAIYYMWLHESRFEFEEGSHPSWKGYTTRTFAEIREIKKTMTREEISEFNRKTKPFLI